ncbi:MAG: MOSC domain-containing protein, partial [Calditrichaeota bacterium]|nr:MOSC domain-containing protein [Calditrichota bacterium]
MKNESRVVSLNRGVRQQLQTGKKLIETGIFKQPVLGKVSVTAAGLVDDVIGNQKHHGGKDQALYLYSGDDYQWWSEETGR